MKKITFVSAIGLCLVMTMSSCRSTIIPQAINTVNAVSLEEMNLERKDYIVLNTVSAEASIICHYGRKDINIKEVNDEFSITFTPKKSIGKKVEGWEIKNVKGIARFGFLKNDYDMPVIGPYPHYVVRELAIYRLINASKVAGADGVIEPVISTNVEQGRTGRDIIYKTTVSAKLIKIKPDGK